MIINEYNNGVFKDRTASLLNFITIVCKRFNIVLVVFFSVVISATFVSFMTTPIFKASSKILIERKDSSDKAFFFRMNLPRNYETYDWIKSEIEIIKSYPIASRVVNDLILEKIDQTSSILTRKEIFEQEVENFLVNLKVENARNSNVIEVSYKSKDQSLVAPIVDKVIETYQIYRSEIYEEFDTYQFFEEQMTITDKTLRELEQSQASYKRREEMIAPKTQVDILLTKLSDYEKSLTAVLTKRIGKEAKLEMIKEKLAMDSEINIPFTEVSEGNSRDLYIAKLKGELLDKRIQKEQLLQRFKPTYGEIIDLEKIIAITKKHIKREVLDIIEQEEASIQALQAEEEALQKLINKINEKIKQFAQKEYELTQLSRGIDENREVYSILLKQREEARISLAKTQKGVKIMVINPAIEPKNPISPNKKLNVTLASFLGLLTGIGIAFLVEYLSNSISTDKELKKFTGLKVLGSVKEHNEVGKL